MANPVIFDDGGSTRIKLLLSGGGAGVMDGLLDVDLTAVPPVADATVNHNYNNLKISAIDATGGAAAIFNSPLIAADNFTISSDNGQIVKGVINGTGHLTITVQGGANNPPLMEAKQFRKKRRYVIVNAGLIQQVSGVANGAPFNFNTTANLYTSVCVSD